MTSGCVLPPLCPWEPSDPLCFRSKNGWVNQFWDITVQPETSLRRPPISRCVQVNAVEVSPGQACGSASVQTCMSKRYGHTQWDATNKWRLDYDIHNSNHIKVSSLVSQFSTASSFVRSLVVRAS